MDSNRAAANHVVAQTVQSHHGRGAPDDQLVMSAVTSHNQAEQSYRGDGSDNLVVGTLDADRGTPRGNGSDPIVAATLTSGAHASRIPGRHREDDENLIAFDMAQVTHPENRAACEPGSPAPSLAKTGSPCVAYSVRSATGTAKLDHAAPAEVAGAIDSNGNYAANQGGTVVCVYPDAVREGVSRTPTPDAEGRVRLRDPGLGVREGGPAYALGTGEPPAVAFNWRKDSDGAGAGPVASTLGSHHSAQDAVVTPRSRVRRFMPVECERLQALPDGWTLIEGASDSQRYRVIGNSVAIVVLEWIGRRLPP